ncbi:hypothetical protein KEM48_013861 [Puccinia striiformis f. sp. tritici PST-130]|nr:hypothetical protein KEM48_013861 [Puccinia striiformis f. sp. tritici PST-130]
MHENYHHQTNSVDRTIKIITTNAWIFKSLSRTSRTHPISPSAPRPPPNPFSCLDSLRSLEKNLTHPNLFDESHQQNSDWSTGINRLVVRTPVANRSHTEPIDSHPVFEDEELCWKASTLIWSKGSLILRKFDYSTTNSSSSQDTTPTTSRQHVIQALFAYFDPPSSTQSSSSATSSDHLGASLPFQDQIHSTQFETSKTPSSEPWSDNRLTQRSDQQKRWRASTTTPSLADRTRSDDDEKTNLSSSSAIHQSKSSLTGHSNQLKLRNLSRRRSILGDNRWPSSVQAGSTSDLLGFDSMITENETHLWSSLAGADLEDHHLPDHDHMEDGEEGADERDVSAELARYWAERKQIEASMLWTLSDPCTHYIQPVLTTERIILPERSLESTPTPRADIEQDPSASGKHAASTKFCQAFLPLAPLVTPPRRPASTEGFTVLLYGRLPSTAPNSSGLISPFECTSPVGIPEEEEEDHIEDEVFLNFPRSPSPPSHPAHTTEEPQLRRSPRKNPASRTHLSPVEPLRNIRQAPRPSMDTHKLSPTLSRTNRTLPRLGGLGHPSLRRSLSQSQGNPTGSISIKKRGMNAGPAASSNVVGGRRVSLVSNASHVSFAFGSSVGQSSIALPGGNTMTKPSSRKSLAEQQLEMMSEAATGNRMELGTRKNLASPWG